MTTKEVSAMAAKQLKRATSLFIVIVSGGIMIWATFGQYALGVLGWAFEEELAVSTSMIGILTAIMFGASGVASFFVGMIADRFDIAWLTLLQIVLAAIVFGIFAFVESQTMLVIACILIGAIMALCNPLSNRVVSMYLPQNAHAVVISWKSIGPQLGALFAGVAFGGIAELFYWRHIVIVLVLAMAAFGAYCFFALRGRALFDPIPAPVAPETRAELAAETELTEPVDSAAASAAPVDEVLAASAETEQGGDVVAAIEDKTMPIAWWLIPFAFFSGGAIASIGAYIPLYASQTMGMTLTAAGIAAAVIAGVSILARFLWVALLRVFDYVMVFVLAGVTATLSTIVLAIAPQFGEVVFWVAIVATGATALGAAPVLQIVLVQSASRKQVGFISAMVGVGLYAGFAFQPLGLAYIIDNVGFDISWYFMAGSALVATLIIIAYAMIHGRPEGPAPKRVKTARVRA